MAPPRNQRSRKRCRKKSDRFPWIMTAVITLILSLSFFHISTNDAPESPDGSKSDNRIQQCKESCNEIIFSRSNLLEPSPGTLASSAVDALFNFRETDDDKSKKERDARDSDTASRNDNNSKNAKYIENNNAANNDDLFKNLSPRPDHLPPLIEKLIGTVDGGDDFIQSPSSSKHGVRLVRNDSNSNGMNHGDHSVRGSKEIIARDDSVAMAAAAAAAAVWSGSSRKRGRLRMKAFKDEWEGSLRWIASWGQQHHEGMGHVTPDVSNAISDVSQRSKLNSRGERRKSRGSHGQSSSLESINIDDNTDLALLLDICIDECSGKDGIPRDNTDRDGGSNVKNMITGQQSLTPSLDDFFEQIKSFQSWFVNMGNSWFPSKKLFRYSRSSKKVLSGVLGMFVSSTFLWGFHHVTKWWRLVKYTSSVKSLLEEEGNQTSQLNKKTQNNQSKNILKKNGTKRTRRRRGGNKHHREDAPFLENDKKETIPKFVKQLGSDWNIHDDDSLVSDNSFEHVPYRVSSVRKDHMQRFADSTSEEHISRGNTSSTSSLLTEEALSEDHVAHESASHISDTHMEESLFVQKSIKSSQLATIEIPSPPKGDTHKVATNEEMHKDSEEDMRAKTFCVKPLVMQSKGRLPSKSSENFSNQRSANYIHKNIHAVPTQEQREEAARKLREFQLAQIQKIIEQRISKKTHESNAKRLQSAKAIPLQSLARMHASNGLSIAPLETLNTTNSSRSPQSGMAVQYGVLGGREEQVMNENISTIDYMASDNLLPSNILTEEVDVDTRVLGEESSENERILKDEDAVDFKAEDMVNNLLEPMGNEEDVLNMEQKQVPSIALGNLLSGGFSSPVSKLSSSSSTSPWAPIPGQEANVKSNINVTSLVHGQSPVAENTTIHEGIIERDDGNLECEDANICLKVSAKVFSPSWGGDEKKDISSSKLKIW